MSQVIVTKAMVVRVQWALLAAMALSLSGCGGSGVDDKFKGERGSVSGKVTYKGSPVPVGSSVVFQSKEGGYTGQGKTNDKGEFSLTYDGRSTMPAVTYVVMVSPPPVAQATVDPAKATGEFKAPVAPFPAKYSAPGSGLEFTVKGGANKDANFDLVD